MALLKRTQVQLGVLVDERMHDIHLPPRAQLAPEGTIHIVAVLLIAQNRLDGLASRRQFVDDADVEVAIDSHRQRARDGRRRHHQHMRRQFGLFPQPGTLGHAEAVLLVDDGHAEVAELHSVLDEGVRAD